MRERCQYQLISVCPLVRRHLCQFDHSLRNNLLWRCEFLSEIILNSNLRIIKAYGSSRIAGGQVQQILNWPGSFETFRKACCSLIYRVGWRSSMNRSPHAFCMTSMGESWPGDGKLKILNPCRELRVASGSNCSWNPMPFGMNPLWTLAFPNYRFVLPTFWFGPTMTSRLVIGWKASHRSYCRFPELFVGICKGSNYSRDRCNR